MNSIGSEPEGATPIDPDEMEGLKHRHITTRDELNELEQANIESGLL
jgi:fido (protein-threonine AMPylation protein)